MKKELLNLIEKKEKLEKEAQKKLREILKHKDKILNSDGYKLICEIKGALEKYKTTFRLKDLEYYYNLVCEAYITIVKNKKLYINLT